MPSGGVKRLAPLTVAVGAVVVLVGPVWPATHALAGQLGTAIPANCRAHTSFSGGNDVPDDYLCAGMAIEFHTGGVANSPFPIWAGQWLFTDPDGQYRVGTCTFNRGTHPTVAVAAQQVTQAFPNDPTGGRSAYLSWLYGDSADDLTAAALWAVFHYYAQDAAGSNRSANATAPLVEHLEDLQAASGRADLQARAIELDAEAARLAGEWQLTLSLAADGTVTATLLAGTTPVVSRPITVLVSGSDLSHSAITGADGTATVALPPLSGTVTVAATASGPGPASVFRGVPAAPNPFGAQLLVTAGPPVVLSAVATLDVPEATTTTDSTTTTSYAVTTTSEATTTTTTEAATTTTDAPATTTTTEAATMTSSEPPMMTTSTEQATTTTPPPLWPEASPPTSAAAALPPSLPRTGGGGGNVVAYVATAFLVGGIGLSGTLRRRVRPTYT